MRWQPLLAVTLLLVLCAGLSQIYPQLSFAQEADGDQQSATAQQQPTDSPAEVAPAPAAPAAPAAPPATTPPATTPPATTPLPTTPLPTTPLPTTPAATPPKVVDPFEYRGSAGQQQNPTTPQDFIPVDTQIPRGIRVMGVLTLASGHSVAVLRLPGKEGVAYVSEGDDLPVRVMGPSAAAGEKVSYLRIQAITPRYVKVYPEKNPSYIQILR